MRQKSKSKQIVIPVALVVAGWMLTIIAVALSSGAI